MEKCIIKTFKQLLPYEYILPLQRDFPLELPDQRTIRTDCARTRATLLSKEERDNLELILTVYCRNQGVKYKQGMNEVLAPFLLLVREGLSLNEAFTLFATFIDKMLPTMFKDDSFRPLQGLFMIFQLLLRYHEPEIFNLLLNNDVSPNCYAASWFITIFANKILEVKIVFRMWEEIVKENDKLFTCYIAVAILRYFKPRLEAGDSASLPQRISALRLSTISEVEDITRIAKEIKKSMPYCFHQKLMVYDVFKLDTIDDIISTLNEEICLSMKPRYIMQRVLPDARLCQKCSVAKCLCFPDVNEIPLIIIDCRSQEEYLEGHLEGSDSLNGEQFEDEKSLKEGILARYTGNKREFHFCLMGSADIKVQKTEMDEDDEDEPQDFLTLVLTCMLDAGFPYVSVVEGGYFNVHEFAMHYRLEISGHERERCSICTPGRKSGNFIKYGLQMIGSKLVQRFKAFHSMVKSIPKMVFEEVKIGKVKGLSRKPSDG